MAGTQRREIDYSLYLVTGRELLPPGKDYYESLEESLQGGVTVVQVREKNIDTGEFVEIARKTKEICDKYNVPLIINDRLDVVLAVDAAGLHIGQTDLPLPLARSLLPAHKTLGISISNPTELSSALSFSSSYAASSEGSGQAGVDYIGVGAVWWTASKDVSKKVMLGTEGVGGLLDGVAEAERKEGRKMGVVAIGGIHLPNLPYLLHGSTSPTHSRTLDGIALISDIVASPTPRQASEELKKVLDSYKRAEQAGSLGLFRGVGSTRLGEKDLVERVVELMKVVREETPLAHQMTNNVVTNDSANATLAMGASPIMANHPEDVVGLSKVIGGLLINMGTISDKQGFIAAGKAANVNRKPIVFDPVAVGATEYRAKTAAELLDSWQPTVIKGNAGEIGALAKSMEVASRGVDAVGSGFADPAAVVKALARKKRCVIVLTGKHDYVSDGEVVVKLSNGDDLLERITGSGCMTGSAITIYLAAARLLALRTSEPYEPASQLVHGDMLVGAIAGCLVYTIAGELAAKREDVKGPGTFRGALIDELHGLTEEKVRELARIEVVG